MLERIGVRYKVVIISACYSGVFIPPLANADTLVITAADTRHASFGREDKANWTYFGDAFFNVALRRATTLKDAFLVDRTPTILCGRAVGYPDPDFPTNRLHISRESIEKNVVFLDG